MPLSGCRLAATLAAIALPTLAVPAHSETRDAFAEMWHEMAVTEYAEMHGPAYAAALADCVLAVFAHLDQADRDILAEYSMNPPEPHASRLDALLPGHAEEMLACGDSVRPEDFNG